MNREIIIDYDKHPDNNGVQRFFESDRFKEVSAEELNNMKLIRSYMNEYNQIVLVFTNA